MNSRIISVPAIFLCFVISGCGIDGHWMNGDPSAGKNIKPYLHYWEKPGVTAESRRQDSVFCGGGDSDNAPQFRDVQLDAVRQPHDKNDFAPRTRLHHDWERCMLNRGYRFTGECHDNDISKAKPACGAP